MKILIVDDHKFYVNELLEKLREDGHNVHYAKNYLEAQSIIDQNPQFDISLLDVILQNGRTGLHLAEEYGTKLGRIMFVTGCNDDTTIKAISTKYASASKILSIWGPLKEFMNGGKPSII